MKRRNILGTDLSVSLVGWGTVKIGRNQSVKYPSNFSIPDDRQVINLLQTVADCGINLIDTAPAYGNSEERLGQLLPQVSNDWTLCTKVGEVFDTKTGLSSYHFSPEFIEASVRHSLQTLKRDVLDIVLIHSDGNDIDIIKRQGALETLSHLKKAGLIRASGMSTKTVEGGLLAAQHSDIAMITHNIEYEAEKPVIEYAEENQKNIFIKKALLSGHSIFQKDKQWSINNFRFIYQNPSIKSIIIGSINPEHIKKNITDIETAIQ